jgi:Predicted dehydrogenases and related proteins
MSKLKFAMIGCGRISHKHVEALVNNLDIANLVAVCDIIPDKAELIKNEYANSNKNHLTPKVYTDYKDMFDNEK